MRTTEIQDMGMSQLFRKYTESIQHIGGFWAEDNSKPRSDALECLHCLFEKGILDEWYNFLVKGCDKAIASYTLCTGYAKQWKQLRQKLFDEAPANAEFTVENLNVRLKHIPELLDYLEVMPDELREFTQKFLAKPHRYKLGISTFLQAFPGISVEYAGNVKARITVDRKVRRDLYRKLVIAEKEK